MRSPGGTAPATALVAVLAACALASCGTPEPPGRVLPSSATAPGPSAAAPAAAPAAGGRGVVGAPPARLRFGGVEAPVVLAPVAGDGSLAVPDDVSELGWWVGSSPMGAGAGTTLIAGHVDSAEQGLGVFAGLRDLDVGDAVTVVDGLGASSSFGVLAVQEVRKSALPPELFSTSGPRRLALVTCAGPFDEEARHYRDNLVVWLGPRGSG